jgi:hypothetical protein
LWIVAIRTTLGLETIVLCVPLQREQDRWPRGTKRIWILGLALLRWLPNLEWVEMPLGSVLYVSGEKPDFVYFPTAAIISLHYVLGDGASAQIAVVGSEGVVGIFVVMGDGATTSRALVQSGGPGVRMPAKEFKSEFNGFVLRFRSSRTKCLNQ